MATSYFFSCRVEDPGIFRFGSSDFWRVSVKAEKLPLFGCDNVVLIQ